MTRFDDWNGPICDVKFFVLKNGVAFSVDWYSAYPKYERMAAQKKKNILSAFLVILLEDFRMNPFEISPFSFKWQLGVNDVLYQDIASFMSNIDEVKIYYIDKNTKLFDEMKLYFIKLWFSVL